MKNAVIYARYSSERQNEQSIEGQIKDCQEWARNNDVNIINTYCDEALTGRSDKRPAFQRMIQDSKNENFSFILVWKIDRFARNRYDSAIYKSQLKKHGVKVISVMEHISDAPEGIILESVLEGMAEYYSANLSQNVLRGMSQNAEEGKHLGGTPPFGYKVDKNKKYVIDENTAPAVKIIFEMYAQGATKLQIAKHLNKLGYKSAHGREFTASSFNIILKNKKYIGIYENMGVTVTGVVQPIISEELFYAVQSKLERNKLAPAHNKSIVDFHLTGKLFCGKCGSNMSGDSGTSHTGTTHYYYSCIEKKRRHGCTKKSVKKEWIEDLITRTVVDQVLTDENIRRISQQAYELHIKEQNDTTELISLQNTLRDTQKVIDNIMSAIEQGIITETTKQRLMEAEERKRNLITSIAKEEIKKPTITQEYIEFFLQDIKNKVYNSEDRTQTIINTFVNAVYLYDDKMTITFNYHEGKSLKKVELSQLSSLINQNAVGFGFETLSSTKTPLWCLFLCLSRFARWLQTSYKYSFSAHRDAQAIKQFTGLFYHAFG